jgi:hypothetical protein
LKNHFCFYQSLLLILLLFWIIPQDIIYFVVFGIIGFIVISVLFGPLPDENERAKKLIVENWTEIEQRIHLELNRHLWIGFSRLSDLAMNWNFSDHYMDHALIKYAIENPDKAVYGQIYEIRNNMPVTLSKVLICLSKLEEEDGYYYE